uniref:asparaginase n=1 Tax=Timema genevievae TaxID=629358 RepID=A0A7R9K3X8_TIMGE|nr:unnamed protein product [Timema genevievae]
MAGLVTGRSRLESRSGAPGRGVRAFLQPPIQGVVLQTYGSGNVPSNRKDLLAAFRDAIRRGVVIINCTQCHHGGVAPLYETGAREPRGGALTSYPHYTVRHYQPLSVCRGGSSPSHTDDLCLGLSYAGPQCPSHCPGFTPRRRPDRIFRDLPGKGGKTV